MELKAKVRTALRPLPAAMAIAIAMASPTLASDISIQERGNAQAEQSQSLRSRGGGSTALPQPGRYVSDSGEGFTLDWIPGTGAVVSVKGVPQGEPFKEPEFFNAILRIWLGPVPADWKLKDALLAPPA